MPEPSTIDPTIIAASIAIATMVLLFLAGLSWATHLKVVEIVVLLTHEQRGVIPQVADHEVRIRALERPETA